MMKGCLLYQQFVPIWDALQIGLIQKENLNVLVMAAAFGLRELILKVPHHGHWNDLRFTWQMTDKSLWIKVRILNLRKENGKELILS
jgi:hypothetical protein